MLRGLMTAYLCPGDQHQERGQRPLTITLGHMTSIRPKSEVHQILTRAVHAALTLATVAILMFSVGIGEAAAAGALGSEDSPQNTFGGRFCGYADRVGGYGAVANNGEFRVYQLAYYVPNEQGLRDAVLNVHENDGDWVQKQMGGWHQGTLLGTVVIGCGVR